MFSRLVSVRKECRTAAVAAVAIAGLFALPAFAEEADVQRIWDEGAHNAFTDLIRFEGAWFCAFREGTGHVGGDGELRVIRSDDGESWSSAALIAEAGIDLRDPKLSITDDGRLMMTAGGSVYEDGDLVGRQPRVMFSKDGAEWTEPARVLEEGDWLWRVTWHNGRAYGVSYTSGEGGTAITLYGSDDGLHYERIADLDVEGSPNETTLRFSADGTMTALVRREGADRLAMAGQSRPPYTEWTWNKTPMQFGGPNFIVLPDGKAVAAGRRYPNGPKTVIARFDPAAGALEEILELPSGGDTSYPGMVWHESELWVSYYASHEGKTNIYLARMPWPVD